MRGQGQVIHKFGSDGLTAGGAQPMRSKCLFPRIKAQHLVVAARKIPAYIVHEMNVPEKDHPHTLEILEAVRGYLGGPKTTAMSRGASPVTSAFSVVAG